MAIQKELSKILYEKLYLELNLGLNESIYLRFESTIICDIVLNLKCGIKIIEDYLPHCTSMM